jgi:signal transduction histidine kinase
MRLWPRSLLGQVLLAVAGALLVAQAISAVLLLRGAEERREQRFVGALAVQLIAAEAGRERAPRRGPGAMRRLRVEIGPAPPATVSDRREPRIAAALAEVIAEQRGAPPSALRVVSRPALGDPRVLERLSRGRRVGPGFPLTEARVIQASLPRGDGQWLTARTLAPGRDRGALRGLVIQTAVLFIALMLVMWLVLRRITGPLASLTTRVEAFARSQRAEGQISAEGPQDVRRLIAAHNRMEARISAMLDEKDVMLGAIGHDLKTPLTALRVRIESVEDTTERAKMAAGIEDITRSLDDILSLARIGRASEPPERTELGALTAAVVEEFEDMGDPVVLSETQRLVLPVHVTWLRRALRNLVSNAVRYGGGAEVSLNREGGEAVLRVGDSGPGIPADRIEAMLEPFTRGETSRNRQTGGAGLGLTLARAIAEQHGGRLVLANRPSGGLAAEIRLPL